MPDYTIIEYTCHACMGPFGNCYTTGDFLDTINREIAKRQTTYPKMIAKRAQQGATDQKMEILVDQLGSQLTLLTVVQGIIKDNIDILDPASAARYYLELHREMQMRKRYYPRAIYFKRIKPEIAAQETAVWGHLCRWFKAKYVGEISTKTLKKMIV